MINENIKQEWLNARCYSSVGRLQRLQSMGCNVTRSRFMSLYLERYIIYQSEAQQLLFVPPNLTLTVVFSEKKKKLFL